MLNNLINDVQYPEEGLSHQVLLNASGGKATLYVFSEGSELKTHKANADVLVVILEGSATITVEDETFEAVQGSSIVFKEGQLHSLKATKRFKMLLIK